jgi:predicted TIM-barrel fold metal-dependent hydrolase
MDIMGPSSVATRADTQRREVVDGDGHIYEDVRGIVERLPEPYRAMRQAQIAKMGSTRLFPPLGYLSAMPFEMAADEARAPEETGLGPDSWGYFLDAVGIDRTVLYPTLGLTVGQIRELDYAIAVTRAYNDWLAETYVRHPSGRFQAAALLPMQAPEAAAAELRRAVTELGFCAGVLPANGLVNHLGSEMYFPVYQAADELGVGLACHGGDGHGGLGLDDFNCFAAVHALCHPFSLLRALGGMVSNRVFELYPRLRVAYLEGGAAWTLVAAERMSESFKAMRPVNRGRVLRLDDGRSMADYLRDLAQADRIVFGCEGGEICLGPAIDAFGCTPFMFSSDFPHEVSAASCRHELEELDELAIGEESKRLLRSGTARTFYSLAD